ncbi:putative bifunctional diguanylate cyclase/phosphodiesterase [Microvirga guangxiensis]|uniref:PAS domain S-box-containing protein/diguanylate cyclase (GGDEF) domain-containing protein n=1 Tax=Microvirga guangxiensis TaxID=549386 RepID=A0A1G5GF12_9HYPH|nr:EAL domain-containing protein [Microvirga guangxiensis]SCY49889.1 PAS domain S-box-containing protein/diguanylate cyclase (GGDEF) domain-containing protein [Microvirga guangxiensis]
MSLRTLKIVLAAVIAGFILSAAYISVLIVERQEVLTQVARYNMPWHASAAMHEFARLEQRLSAYAAQDPTVDKDEVSLRYDIMVSRSNLLQAGDFREFLRAAPEWQETVDELAKTLAEIQSSIENLDRPEAALDIVRALEKLDAKLAGMAAAALHYGGRRAEEGQQELIRLHWMFSSLAAGLIVFGLFLLALLGWHNRLLERAHQELRLYANNFESISVKLEKTNKALSSAYEELQLRNEALQNQEHELRTQNDRFDAALNNMSHGLCMVDSEGRIIVVNARFAQLFGLSSAVHSGISLNHLVAQAEGQNCKGIEPLREILLQQQELISKRQQFAFIHEEADGQTFAISHQPMTDGGWVATYDDITERRRAESQIAYMAHHDALTDLANRVLFRQQLEHALAETGRQRLRMAVLCLDLDRFKDVNDSLGHEMGDSLLKLVAERLRSCIRQQDVVARLGGDEFAVLQLAIDDPQDCAALAVRIVETISLPYDLEGQEIVIGTSIGIAVASEGNLSPDQLLKQADLALYRAKADGRATYRFFEPEMDAELQARRLLETDLRKALANREFELYFQPQVNVRANEIGGYETLLRWRHPERGTISPGDFIPVAEDIGLIAPLGDWVLEQACMVATGWPKHIKVAVNLSPVQFRNKTLVQSVSRALSRSGLAPERLELEITESVLLQDNELTVATLHQLRRMGVRIAMDDFGTGYSSLSYLRSFPFDKIKIDQSFVRELSSRADCLAIVRSIAGLGASLGMSTVAEGVETEDQFHQITAAGCTEVQGFYFGKPKPASELVHTLTANRRTAEVA